LCADARADTVTYVADFFTAILVCDKFSQWVMHCFLRYLPSFIAVLIKLEQETEVDNW